MKLIDRGAIAVVLLGSTACFGDSDLPEAARIAEVSGDGQRATAGNRLASAFTVTVTDDAGTSVPRAKVRWAFTEGEGAMVSDSLTVTDGNGRALAYLTLGPTPGSYVVRAFLDRRSEAAVFFTSVAVEAPQLTSVSPTTFGGGDTIDVLGAFLSDSVRVDFGQVPGEVIASLPETLRVVVPRCLPAGPVEIHGRVGQAVSSPVSGTYQASSEPLRLAVGEYVSIEPAAVGGCATFPDANPSATYLFVAQSAADVPALSLPYRFRGDSSNVPIPVAHQRAPVVRSVAAQFHDFLRAQEAELAARPRAPVPAVSSQTAPIQPAIVFGDRRNFRVCNAITCSAIADFSTIEAAVKFVGDHAIIYQDVSAPTSGLSDQDFQDLGVLFDDELYGVATGAFGAESDLDGNGRVLILFTPIVNSLTQSASCATSFVTGFFVPLDIVPEAVNDPRSNQAEIFYALVPDPQGSVSCVHSVDRITRLVPVTFIHELQHMINFFQHVTFRGGNNEETWLNEAMSHLSEELGAIHFEAIGDDALFARFVLGDLFNAFLYLKDPGAISLLFDSSGGLEERGAGWLFLRWIVDQYGDDVIRRLSETDRTGAANVEAATGESFQRLLAQWSLSNYLSDLPGFTSPAELRYVSWDFRDVYQQLNSQAPDVFDVPFPLDPTSTNSEFSFLGTMLSGSGDYFLVSQSSNNRGFTIEFTAPDGNPLSGDAAPRLNVIRIN